MAKKKTEPTEITLDKYEIDLDKISTLEDMKALVRILLLFVAKSNTEPKIEITSDSSFYEQLKHLRKD